MKIQRRPRTGQSVIALSILVGLIIVPLLGIFAFEIARYQHGMQELNSVCESSALAGAAMLVTSQYQKPVDRMLRFQEATLAAENAFRSSFQKTANSPNDVLGTDLKQAVNVGVNGQLKMGANAGECNFKVEAVDPANLQVVPPTDFNAKAVKVTALFTSSPAFERFFGWKGVVPITRRATAGIPVTDVVVCMDVSGSMDDSTRVSLVNRRYNLPTPLFQDLVNLYNAYLPLRDQLNAYIAKATQATIYITVPDPNNPGGTMQVPAPPPTNYDKNYCQTNFYNPALAAWNTYLQKRIDYGQNFNAQFGKVEYGAAGQGTLYDLVCNQSYPFGTTTNCRFPENLNEIDTFTPPSPDGNPSLPFFNIRERYFQETGDVSGLIPAPPGAPAPACAIPAKPGYPSNFLCYCEPAPSGFTDVIAHVDNRANLGNQQQPMFGPLTTFGAQNGVTYTVKRGKYKGQSYPFLGMPYLVEAQRGNLEVARFNTLKPLFQNNIAAGELPSQGKDGYQAAYFEMISQYMQPMATTVDALENFYQALNGAGSSVRFGMVSFETEVPVASPGLTSQLIPSVANDDTGNGAYIAINSSSPGPAKAEKYPLLYLPLEDLRDPDIASVNDPYGTTKMSLNDIFEQYMIPLRSTNIPGGMKEALKILDQSPRKTFARQVMVLITDGVATIDTTGANKPLNAEAECRQFAQIASNRQIPVFTVGVAQNATIQIKQSPLLGDKDTPSPQGIATISGHGAKYFPVTAATMLAPGGGKVNAISQAFLQVARGLVQLID